MKCEGCGREGTVKAVKRHHGHVHVRCTVCGWKSVISDKVAVAT